MVNIPGHGRDRINAAYGLGGPQLLIDTLDANFGIKINHYLEVDFQSFQAVVDAIGNVKVYLPGASATRRPASTRRSVPGATRSTALPRWPTSARARWRSTTPTARSSTR